ncbi:beta-ketoacyl synthase N-terminal-like domain-containing protein [Brevibacillus sp. MER 51]|uniref:beta-ketoacyl synthase N-terminal-like domain-containing protein n=1 Tax=Brevibacillus sp. MER 51 TaxID=2939560 RepID=UPI00204239D4|nr:beta-ketoacyl synthase N-terminal-like domain-containing protein [Brevibacillus sp. MER 51]MCM3145749.1 phosphopantetheine-binding protein [Brevibacillus sp. MER 51]
MNKMDELLLKLLWGQMQSLGCFAEKNQTLSDLKRKSGLLDLYDMWLEETASVLARNDYLVYDSETSTVIDTALISSTAVWQEWEQEKGVWLKNPDTHAQVKLIEATLRVLPQILTGKVRATEVIFPNSSMELVEKVYKNNRVSDYFNEVLADTVVAFVEERLNQDSAARIRILEIGAGTGGTSAVVFQKLKAYEKHIQEYCYTDLSKAFFMHAEKAYGPSNPYLTYRIFNVEEPVTGQGIDLGGYDIVIAANVLHATKNIRQTVRNAKAVLKKNGLLLLNEMSKNTLFLHLTFGLLEGWWLYEDPELRLSGCPGLSSATWQRVLEEEGFQSVFFPTEEAHAMGQQIIVTESDGVIRQQQIKQPPKPKASVNAEQPKAKRVEIPFAPEGRASKDVLREKSTEYIKHLIAETLKMPSNRMDASEPLEAYGMDSILSVQLINQFRKIFGETISGTLFFEYQTVDDLVEHLLETQREALISLTELNDYKQEPNQTEDQVELAPLPKTGEKRNPRKTRSFAPAVRSQRTASKPASSGKIAIIGMSGRFAQANNLEEFWENLIQGKKSISEIPAKRWDWTTYYHPNREDAISQGKSYSKWGAFLEEFDQFDPLFFHMTPREAENIDPQERLYLEECWKALEDAGYASSKMSAELRKRTGVFGGITKQGFHLYSTETTQHFPTTSYSSMVNRVSYYLNLQGPSMPIDTMCSSALVAIHEACEYIRNGKGSMAIAGGVNLYTHPLTYFGLTVGQLISHTSDSAAFGKGGIGFVPGEGVGAVVLKDYDQAVRDLDHIYAVIRGTAVNHKGKANSYMTPSPNPIADVMEEALEESGLDPRSISYLEASAYGSDIVDAVEMTAVTKAFHNRQGAEGDYRLGSVKPNIGHCESASGMSQLMKVILSLQHQTLVPTLIPDELNPNIHFDQLPFQLQREVSEWKQITVDGQTVPRRAGITSFGGGGVNAHLIVEEYNHTPSSRRVNDSETELFVFSAKNKERLQAYIHRWIAYLHKNRHMDVANTAYTLQIGREEMPCRLAVITDSQTELLKQLERWLEHQEETEHCFFGDLKENKELMADRVTLAIESKDVGELAKLWVLGNPIPWQKLHEGKALSRVAKLPTYPFKRRTCWIERNQTNRTRRETSMTSAHPEFENKAVEIYTYSANSSEAEFSEDYLTVCPFERKIPGFSMSRVILNPEKYPLEREMVREKQVEMRQVLFCKENFSRVKKVLDFGCGHGTDVIQIAELYPHIETHGFTITKAQAELGNQRIAQKNLGARAKIFNKDSSKDAFPDLYDIIVGIEVSFHIRNKQGLFHNISSALNEEGTVLLIDYIANTRGAIVDQNVEVSIPTVQEWIELLAEHQLVIDEIIDVSPQIANALHDPDVEQYIKHLPKAVQDLYINTVNQSISLERGWISYCLFKLKKAPHLAYTKRCEWNASKISKKRPYPEALAEMVNSGYIPYPKQQMRTLPNPNQHDHSFPWNRETIKESLVEAFSTVLGLQPEELGEVETLKDMGIGSLNAVALSEMINSKFNLKLPTSVVFEHDTLDSLAGYIASHLQQGEPSQIRSSKPFESDAQNHSVTPEYSEQKRDMSADQSIPDRTKIKAGLNEAFSAVLGLRQEELEEVETLKDLGIGSLNAVQLSEAINSQFHLKLPTSVVFEHNTLEALASYIATHLPGHQSAQTIRQFEEKPVYTERIPTRDIASEAAKAASDDIAIIGISCRTAGAQGQDEFWELVSHGKDCIKEVTNPDWRAFFKENGLVDIPIKYGAMEDIEYFDPAFFKISPTEAQSMDVTQRILLQESYKALEDAGYTPSMLRGQPVGTIIGAMAGMTVEQDFSHFGMLGSDTSILASRIAYFLDLKGPALAVNTACSSSLVAIDIACQKLKTEEVNLAIAGGITIYSHPAPFISMSNARMLSPTGECRPFDNGANGIVVGDGVGIVILKRLQDALRDNDSIYGVIRGSGTNQDGRTLGITVPSFQAQSDLQKSIYAKKQIDVEDIQYIEAHGTATKLGDPVEIHALSESFRHFTPKKRFCAIGSLKANIGHTTAAAGVLSVIKVLLSMKNRKMAPSIHFVKENEHIDFENSPVYVNTKLQDWQTNSKGSRLAAVSSFGFSGTNAHLVIEEFDRSKVRSVAPVEGQEIATGVFVLSAESREQLVAYAKKTKAFVEKHPEVKLADFLYTYQTARESMAHRVAIVVHSKDQLIALLEQFIQGNGTKTADLFIGEINKTGGIKIGDTEEGRDFIRNLALNKKIKKLAELWVHGNEIEWEALYPKGMVSRLSGLPSYPFAKERYRLPKVVVGNRTHQEAAATSELTAEKHEHREADIANSTEVTRVQAEEADGREAEIQNSGIHHDVIHAEDDDTPRNELVRKIAAAWEEVLGVKKVDIHKNFQDLGGDSIMATQIISRLKNSFPVDLNLDNLFSAPTVAGMAELIEEELIAVIDELPEEAILELLS